MWESSRAACTWNPKFLRSFNDWEKEIVQNFISLINNKEVSPTKKDRLVEGG